MRVTDKVVVVVRNQSVMLVGSPTAGSIKRIPGESQDSINMFSCFHELLPALGTYTCGTLFKQSIRPSRSGH